MRGRAGTMRSGGRCAGSCARCSGRSGQRQQRAVEEVLGRAAVVCTTLTGALSRDARRLRFDLAVVDEAAQVGPGCSGACRPHA